MPAEAENIITLPGERRGACRSYAEGHLADVVRLNPPRPRYDENGNCVRQWEEVYELPDRTPEIALIGAILLALDGVNGVYQGEKMRLTACVQHILRDLERADADDMAELKKARRFADAIADSRIRRRHPKGA